MKRVCAYCNTVISPGDSPDGLVSHGICDSCTHRVLSRLGLDISAYLDMLDAPVILVNPEGLILDASSDAGKFAGKSSDQIVDTLTGDALGCSNACQPGGCGKSVCCSGCVIRNSVRKTYETGEPVNRIPAILNQGTPDKPDSIELNVSTRKAGPVILVRIEPAVPAES